MHFSDRNHETSVVALGTMLFTAASIFTGCDSRSSDVSFASLPEPSISSLTAKPQEWDGKVVRIRGTPSLITDNTKGEWLRSPVYYVDARYKLTQDNDEIELRDDRHITISGLEKPWSKNGVTVHSERYRLPAEELMIAGIIIVDHKTNTPVIYYRLGNRVGDRTLNWGQHIKIDQWRRQEGELDPASAR